MLPPNSLEMEPGNFLRILKKKEVKRIIILQKPGFLKKPPFFLPNYINR